MAQVALEGQFEFMVCADFWVSEWSGSPWYKPVGWESEPAFCVHCSSYEGETMCIVEAEDWQSGKNRRLSQAEAVATMERFVAEAQAALEVLRAIEPTRSGA